MKKRMPLVSIIMPVYNSERFLRSALDSLLRQTYNNFELIVVNDGSKDGSAAIIDEYAARDNRIKAFHKNNSGVVDTANFAASHATGEFIMRTDSDDVSFDNKLMDLVNCALNNPSAILVTGNIEVVDENEEYLYKHVIPPLNDEIKRAMYIYNPIANGATMIKRSAFEEVGRYSNVFAEDFDLWVKLFNMGEFVATDTTLYRWRINPDGLTMSNNKKSIDKEKEYADKLWARTKPKVISRKKVIERSDYYYKRFKKNGVSYKRIFLSDLARVAIHLLKRGDVIACLKQWLIIASTGRTGLKTVLVRISLILGGRRPRIRRSNSASSKASANSSSTFSNDSQEEQFHSI